MPEEVMITFMMMFLAVVAYAGYVRLFTVRRLRKKLDRMVEQAIARGPVASAPVLAAPAADANEMRKIHQRLQVLERIVVDKEASLSREIDELRTAEA